MDRQGGAGARASASPDIGSICAGSVSRIAVAVPALTVWRVYV